MTDLIVSALLGPKMIFPRLGMLVLIALGSGAGTDRRMNAKKKAAPRDGRESLRRGCLKGPIFVHRSGTYRKCEVIPVSLQELQLSSVVSCAGFKWSGR